MCFVCFLHAAEFSIFISDMESGMECTSSKFADHTKLSDTADLLKGSDSVQRDTGRLRGGPV